MSAAANISGAGDYAGLSDALQTLDDRVLALLEQLPEHVQEMFAKHLAEQVAARLLGAPSLTEDRRRLVAVPDEPAPIESEVLPGRHDLLTIKEVMAIPRYRALGERWLRQNAGPCGATRKGGRRSALMFTCAGIDAELRRRQLAADTGCVPSAEVTPIVRGPKRSKSEVTPNGNPRSFAIRAPGKAA